MNSPFDQSQNLPAALRAAGLRPKKGLGQNFLMDDAALDEIVAAAELSQTDTVLEVGPGLGILTKRLCQQAQTVVAVEADAELARLLQEQELANLELVAGDILDFNLTKLPADYKVVANIPYYLTSQLLRRLLESANQPSRAVLLVQKEVAERVTADPGQLSILALSVQYYAYAKIMGQVERHKFWPAPKVDSAILVLERRPQPAFAADTAKLFRLIKAGFGERRKQLKNSLAGGLNVDTDRIEAALKSSRIKPTQRAQELELKDWQRLYQRLIDQKLL